MDLTKFEVREDAIKRLEARHRSSAGAADTFQKLFAHSPLPAYLMTEGGDIVVTTAGCGTRRGIEWDWDYNGTRYVIGVVYGDQPRPLTANGHAG